VVPVKTSGVKCQDLRKAGPLHVGHQMWQRLQMVYRARLFRPEISITLPAR
jgi:hypothetical protein